MAPFYLILLNGVNLPSCSYQQPGCGTGAPYKYLGRVIDHKLSFGPQVDDEVVCKKAHRHVLNHKLQNFSVDASFMKMFYSCFIKSVLTLSFIC